MYRKGVMSMKTRRVVYTAALAAALLGVLTTGASAMHIAEGYLPPAWCVGWGLACLPFLAAGLVSIKKRVEAAPRAKILLAMCGAFAFVLSALKIPSLVGGSCSHPTGVGLGAVLFGPTATAVLGLIVLIFQALLLAHGGLTTLGANVFSMAIAGPLVSWGVYRLLEKAGVKPALAVFCAAALGDLFTYCVTSLQLALAYPSQQGGVAASALKFLGVFAPTQVPLAVIEGILTVVIVIALESYAQPELKLIGYYKEGR